MVHKLLAFFVSVPGSVLLLGNMVCTPHQNSHRNALCLARGVFTSLFRRSAGFRIEVRLYDVLSLTIFDTVQVLFGIFTGIAAMLLFDQLTAYRSKKRLLRVRIAPTLLLCTQGGQYSSRHQRAVDCLQECSIHRRAILLKRNLSGLSSVPIPNCALNHTFARLDAQHV
jgi:hypothetical protein